MGTSKAIFHKSKAISVFVTDVGTHSVTDARMIKTLLFELCVTERVGALHSQAAAAFHMVALLALTFSPPSTTHCHHLQ